MALSNIAREPRRELTEQALGLAAALGLIVIDGAGAAGLCQLADGTIFVPWKEFALCMFLMIPIIFLGGTALAVIHWLGEEVCDFMANRGYDPRPTQRWR